MKTPDEHGMPTGILSQHEFEVHTLLRQTRKSCPQTRFFLSLPQVETKGVHAAQTAAEQSDCPAEPQRPIWYATRHLLSGEIVHLICLRRLSFGALPSTASASMFHHCWDTAGHLGGMSPEDIISCGKSLFVVALEVGQASNCRLLVVACCSMV